MKEAPRFDVCDTEAIIQGLLASLPAYVPGWEPTSSGPGQAILQVYARYLRALAERIDRAPAKHRLAFLQMLGIGLMPAQAARAPLVFETFAGIADSRLPEKARAGAGVPDQLEPVVFETERATALASARLREVVSVWPGADSYADHSADHLAGRPFTLFGPLKPIPHVLYLAHDELLAFTGQCTVEVRFELAVPAGEALPLAWEYWDGEVWRGFKPFAEQDSPKIQDQSFDGTDGLSRSGIVRLVSDCAQSERRRVDAIEGYWLRARLDGPLTRRPGLVLPEITRIRVRTLIRKDLWTVIVSDGKSEGTNGVLVRGLVVHEDGSPVPDVELGFLTPGTFNASAPIPQGTTAKTDESGSFCWEGAQPNTSYDVVIGGAIPAVTTTVHVESKPIHLELVLKKDGTVTNAVSFETVSVSGRVVHADGSPVPDVELGFKTPGVSGLPGSKSAKTDESGSFTWCGAQPDTSYDVAFWSGPVVTTVRVRSNPTALELVVRDGAAIDAASINGQSVDPGSPFAIVGPVSEVGSTCSIRCDELFGKSGARFYYYAPPSLPVPNPKDGTRVAWQYWNGRRWSNFHFDRQGAVVPADLAPTSVNGIEGRWARLLLSSGGYVVAGTDQPAPYVVTQLRFGYRWQAPEEPVQACLTCNDFQWGDQSDHARWAGTPFAPFAYTDDATPTLYLGFDQALPADLISLYLDIIEAEGTAAAPTWLWEYWDGGSWAPLGVEDETSGMALPGMVAALWPGVDAPAPLDVLHAEGARVQLLDPRLVPRLHAGDRIYISGQDRGEMATVAGVEAGVVSLATGLAGSWIQAKIAPAGLARFGTPRTWLRARQQSDGEPVGCRFNGIHLNAVWGIEAQTFENELLGAGTGQPGQVLFARNTPVLPGEVLEMRELQGARAEIELPTLLEDVERKGLTAQDVRTLRDRRSGRIAEVWVRWQARPHLYFSGPDDRHYMIERSGGRLIFGDGVRGRVLPAGRDNARLARYRSGGGSSGNVPAGTIRQLLAGGAVQSVTNPHDAEGGADGEVIEQVPNRGAGILRHFHQAISAADYEDLARQASPAVAYARALPTTHPSGRPEPGWVKVIIVPRSRDPRPQPSFGLKKRVRDYLGARTSATLAGQVTVIGPEYLAIGVEAVLVPRDPSNAGTVHTAVTETVQGFLHPLTGGPEGRGWPAGRDVFLSDLAASVLRVPGLDRVALLRLLTEGTPRGELVAVPEDRIVVAGPLRIRLQGAQG